MYWWLPNFHHHCTEHAALVPRKASEPAAVILSQSILAKVLLTGQKGLERPTNTIIRRSPEKSAKKQKNAKAEPISNLSMTQKHCAHICNISRVMCYYAK